MVAVEVLLTLILLVLLAILIRQKPEKKVELKPQPPPPPQVKEVQADQVQSPTQSPVPSQKSIPLEQSPKLPEKAEKKRKKKNRRVTVVDETETAANAPEQLMVPLQKPNDRAEANLIPMEYVPLGPITSTVGLERQQRLEEIGNEILMIESTFPREFEQLIPHTAQLVGYYRLVLAEDDKKVTVKWHYSNETAAQPPALQIVSVEGTKLFEEQIRYLVQNADLQQPGTPVFDLLLLLNELVMMKDHNDSSPSRIHEQIVNKTSQLLGQKPEPSAVESAMNNTRRRQQYGELIDQIIFTPYLQGDFRQAPEFDVEQSKVSHKTNRRTDQKSRYKSEFDQIRKLGQGGFGSVFLAKNLLDYNYNAVKKIRLNVADPFSRKVKKEVILLSSLNHPNIVRYYQSWIEEAADLDELCAELGIEDSDERQELEEEYKDYMNRSEDGEIYIGQKSSEQQSQHDEDLGGISDISNHTSFFIRQHNSLDQQITEKKSESESQKHRNHQHDQHGNKSFPFRIMYIAMEYCDGNTLKDLITQELQGRKHDDNLEEFKIRVLRGILQALVYLHDKKIIHRDIKPANIFLDKKKQRVKLGDFGLAANIEDGLAEKGLIGTIRYKAPQQGENGEYSQKVDMYSLGVIMFEMFYCRKYGTESERQQTFKLLKQQKLPQDFDHYCRNPDIRQLLKNLVSRNPNQRPSAKELLSKVKNKLFVQLVSAITNPNHFEFRSLLNSLFQIKNINCQGTHRDSFRRYNYAQIESIFRCHGGNNIHVTPMIPVQDYLQLNKRKVYAGRQKKLLALSQQGGVFEMCSRSYQPWLKWMRDYLVKNIKNKPRCIRRYSFCEVYEHEDAEQSVQHRQRVVGVFDVVIDLNREYLAKHQSQLIKLSVQATNDKECLVHISHSLLLKILCEQLRFPEETLYKALLSHQFEKTIQPAVDRWQQAFKQQDINDSVSRRLIKFFRVSATNPKDFIEQLQSQELSEANFSQVLKQLQTIDRLIQLMGINLVVYRLMIPYESSCGIFWKVVKTPQDNRCCVGGFTTMEEYHRNEEICLLHVEIELTVIPKPQLEVYVWSIGDLFEKEMVEIVNQCWQNGIYADWSNECMGQKVEGVRVGLILRRVQKKLHISIRKFGSPQQLKAEWYALQNFNMGMLKTVLQEK